MSTLSVIGDAVMKELEVHAETDDCEANYAKAEAKAENKDYLAKAEANAKALSASAGARANPLGASADAQASVAQSEAKASFGGIIEAKAGADFCKATAGAESSLLKGTLINAEASARVAKAEAGIDWIPMANASVSLAEAKTGAGIGWEYTGAEIGASLAEAQAGPFAVRAGLKFGVALKKGVPQIDAGPVSCSFM